MKRLFRTLVAAALVAVVAAPAWAQSTWNYSGFTETTGVGSNAGTFGNSWSNTVGSTKLTVTAFSSTGAGSAFQTSNIANYGAGSGFGVRNQVEGLGVSSPQHAMDNYAHTDMLALNFTNASTAAAVNVVLTDLMIGWHNTSTTTGLICNGSQANCVDTDISLLRWSGATGPTITGGTISSLLAAGWQLVNNYANLTDDVNRATGATNSQASSWWLISAYNSAWGTGSNTTNLSNGDDFMKVLSSVTAKPGGKVPEPSSLALFAVALFAGVALRRRGVTRRH